MKNYYYYLLFLLASFSVQAQEYDVTVEYGKVTLNGTEIFTYERIGNKELTLDREYSFYNKNGDEVLVYMTKKVFDPDDLIHNYFIINFLKENIKITAPVNDHVISGLGLEQEDNLKKMLEWLLENGALNPDGVLTPKKPWTFTINTMMSSNGEII